MVKYLVSLLVSSNLDIFKITFDSVLNQLDFNNYDIFIIVNTLDELFYNDLLDYFKNNKFSKLKKIIRTPSDGNPGKGYNSIFKLFKTYIEYDYLIFMDGDDFLYPKALNRIDTVLKETNGYVQCGSTNEIIKYKMKIKILFLTV